MRGPHPICRCEEFLNLTEAECWKRDNSWFLGDVCVVWALNRKSGKETQTSCAIENTTKFGHAASSQPGCSPLSAVCQFCICAILCLCFSKWRKNSKPYFPHQLFTILPAFPFLKKMLCPPSIRRFFWDPRQWTDRLSWLQLVGQHVLRDLGSFPCTRRASHTALGEMCGAGHLLLAHPVRPSWCRVEFFGAPKVSVETSNAWHMVEQKPISVKSIKQTWFPTSFDTWMLKHITLIFNSQ